MRRKKYTNYDLASLRGQRKIRQKISKRDRERKLGELFLWQETQERYNAIKREQGKKQLVQDHRESKGNGLMVS